MTSIAFFVLLCFSALTLAQMPAPASQSAGNVEIPDSPNLCFCSCQWSPELPNERFARVVVPANGPCSERDACFDVCEQHPDCQDPDSVGYSCSTRSFWTCSTDDDEASASQELQACFDAEAPAECAGYDFFSDISSDVNCACFEAVAICSDKINRNCHVTSFGFNLCDQCSEGTCLGLNLAPGATYAPSMEGDDDADASATVASTMSDSSAFGNPSPTSIDDGGAADLVSLACTVAYGAFIAALL